MIITININGIERKLDVDIENEKHLVIDSVKDILNYLEENKQPNF